MDGRIKLELEKKQDSSGKDYYVTKLRGPFQLDAKDGLCFLVFVSEEGGEELQICADRPPKDKNDRHKTF